MFLRVDLDFINLVPVLFFSVNSDYINILSVHQCQSYECLLRFHQSISYFRLSYQNQSLRNNIEKFNISSIFFSENTLPVCFLWFWTPPSPSTHRTMSHKAGQFLIKVYESFFCGGFFF